MSGVAAFVTHKAANTTKNEIPRLTLSTSLRERAKRSYDGKGST
jgi:hypothetical protein